MRLFLVLALVLAVTTAAPPTHWKAEDDSSSQCKNVMKAHGLTPRFPGAVAHALHSLTLQDIRYYFEPLASPDILIPSVNVDISSENPILFHVVDAPNTNTFDTVAMRVVDEVLSQMDNKNYMAKGNSPLENLVHGLHMHEEWAKLSAAYKKLKITQPNDEELCSCVLDIEANGILKMLRHTALRLREPKLMYGTYEKVDEGFGKIGYDDVINVYTFNFVGDFKNELPSKKDAFPLLTNPDDWRVWKEAGQKHVMHDFDEVATFLYCTLK